MDLATPGSIIDDKYTVLSVLGTGGMGIVVKAKQAGLDRIVAIKLVHRTFLHDDESLARFEREGQALSAVTHKNIGTFYSYGFWKPRTQSIDTPYIVMEYLEGKSLQTVIHESGALDWKRTVRIGMQITEAMEHMHAAGLLHRDLKPSNVLLLNQPEADFVKVVDFGLAKFVADLASTGEQKLTQTGELVGTIQYMSPEICSGNKPDERSDIYSLGVLLYESLTATLPYQADSPIGVIYKCVNEEIEAPSKRSKEKFPAALEAVLMKALAKDPANRFQSMSELKNDLYLINSDQGTKCLAVVNPVTSYSKKATKFNKRFLQTSIFCAIVLAVGCFCFAHSKRIQAPAAKPSSSSASIVKESLAYITSGKDAKFNQELDASARRLKENQVELFVVYDKFLGTKFLPKDLSDAVEDGIKKKGKPLENTQIYGAWASHLWDIREFDQAKQYAILELRHHQSQVKLSNLACARSLEILGRIESSNQNLPEAIYFWRQCNRLVLAQPETLDRNEYELISRNQINIACRLHSLGSIKEATEELAAFLSNPKLLGKYSLTKLYLEAAKYYDDLGKRKESIKCFQDAIADSRKYAPGRPGWEQRCTIFKEAFLRAFAHGERAEIKKLLEQAAKERDTGITDSAAAESPDLLCLEYSAELQLLESKHDEAIETLSDVVEYTGKLQFDEVEHWRRNVDRLRITLRHENRQKEIRSFELQMLNHLRKAPKARFKGLLWFYEYALVQRDSDDLLEKIGAELEHLERKEKDKVNIQTWLLDSALRLRKKKQFDKARPLLEKAYKLDEHNFRETYTLGYQNRSNRSIAQVLIDDCLRAGKAQSAMAMIDKAASDAKADSPFVVPILLQKSEILRHSGKLDEALDVLNKVQQCYESDKDALKPLAGKFLVLQTLKENWIVADKLYAEMKNETGSDPWATIFYLKRKHLYKELEQYMKANQERQYEEALRHLPATDTSSRCTQRGCISSDADHFAEALIYFNKGIELTKREKDSQQRAAQIEARMGDTSVLSRKLKQACQHWKNSLNLCQEPYDEILIAKQHLGWYYLHIGNLEQAMKLLKEGYDDFYKPAYLNSGYELFYGSCFAQKGQLKEAFNVFQDHNSISFDDIGTWSGDHFLKSLALARAYNEYGEYQKAENLLSICVRFAKTEYNPCDLLWHEVFSLYRDTLRKCGKQSESQAAEAELNEPLVRNYRYEWYYERP